MSCNLSYTCRVIRNKFWKIKQITIFSSNIFMGCKSKEMTGSDLHIFLKLICILLSYMTLTTKDTCAVAYDELHIYSYLKNNLKFDL